MRRKYAYFLSSTSKLTREEVEARLTEHSRACDEGSGASALTSKKLAADGVFFDTLWSEPQEPPSASDSSADDANLRKSDFDAEAKMVGATVHEFVVGDKQAASTKTAAELAEQVIALQREHVVELAIEWAKDQGRGAYDLPSHDALLRQVTLLARMMERKS